MALLTKIREQYGGFDKAIKLIGESCLETYADRLYLAFCKQYKGATYITNIEWLLRHFHASKKMTLSALFFTQANELISGNMKNLTFYACYYSLFNALSSNLILHPHIGINDVRRISHKRVFTDIENYFIKFGIYDHNLIDLLNELRLTRELYSYHLPLGGSVVREGEHLNVDVLFTKLEAKLAPILQVSNLFSFLSHFAWEKKAGMVIDEYDHYQETVDQLFFSFIEMEDHLGRHYVVDDDDYARQRYVLRKMKTPFPISWFITEKMCEDLECGWGQDDSVSGFDITNVAQYLARAIDTP